MHRKTETSIFVVALPEPPRSQPTAVFLPRPQTASASRPRTSNRRGRSGEIIINNTKPEVAPPAQTHSSNEDQAIPSFIQVGPPKPHVAPASAPMPDVEEIVPHIEIVQSDRAQAEQAEIDEEEANDKCSRYVVIGVLVFFGAFLGAMMLFIKLHD